MAKTLDDASQKSETWINAYNTEWPHGAIGN
ncbi:MAG: integrase core domain-containing protein [Beijerinckiaceae bacterium]